MGSEIVKVSERFLDYQEFLTKLKARAKEDLKVKDDSEDDAEAAEQKLKDKLRPPTPKIKPKSPKFS